MNVLRIKNNGDKTVAIPGLTPFRLMPGQEILVSVDMISESRIAGVRGLAVKKEVLVRAPETATPCASGAGKVKRRAAQPPPPLPSASGDAARDEPTGMNDG